MTRHVLAIVKYIIKHCSLKRRLLSIIEETNSFGHPVYIYTGYPQVLESTRTGITQSHIYV